MSDAKRAAEAMRAEAAALANGVAAFHRKMFMEILPNPSSNQRHLLAAEACETISRDIETLPLPDATQDPHDAALAKAHACLAFFASVIKSGEEWSDTCEREFRQTLAAIEHAHERK